MIKLNLTMSLTYLRTVKLDIFKNFLNVKEIIKAVVISL